MVAVDVGPSLGENMFHHGEHREKVKTLCSSVVKNKMSEFLSRKNSWRT